MEAKCSNTAFFTYKSSARWQSEEIMYLMIRRIERAYAPLLCVVLE